MQLSHMLRAPSIYEDTCTRSRCSKLDRAPELYRPCALPAERTIEHRFRDSKTRLSTRSETVVPPERTPCRGGVGAGEAQGLRPVSAATSCLTCGSSSCVAARER
jgi:hypothetical protein